LTKQTLHTNTPVKADFEIPQQDLPSHARVVIVGGGIAGASVAYHLARAGWDNVVLLEQNRISSGTTWHAAGMVGQLRSSSAQTKVNKASVEIYSQLLADTGHDPGWLQCGGLQLAACQERMYQLQRTAAMAEVYGVDAQIITADQCRDYWPMLNIDDLVGGVFLPGDGRVLPGECTVALAKGAMQRGVQVIEQTEVTDFVVQSKSQGIKRITGVKTNRGVIAADWVVLAGNMWMRQMGLKIGIDIPIYPCEHHYLITRPIEGVTRDCPCTRDPDAVLYFRSLDDGGMKLGAFKKRTKTWQIGDRVPNDFSFSLLEPDWPDFEQPFTDLQHRLKGLTRDDVVKFVNGPEAFTPDNNFIMGQPLLTEGLFVLGGWNSAGIACSAGAAKYAVEWIENGGMTLDLGSVDVRRFMPFQNGRKYLQERVSEVLGLHYQMAWPGRQMETSRGVRHSPLYEKHRELNACFGETAGWERPLFYAPKGEPAEIQYSFLRQNWQDYTNEEVQACRQDVALLDQSTFAKYRLVGADALTILQRLCGANIDVPIGKTVYTAMLNDQGTFESDLTVIRESDNSFYIVTATGGQQKDFDWITRHIPADSDARLTDITADVAVLSVMGPKSRDRLAPLCTTELSDEAFPFGTSQTTKIAGATVRAIRISYVGELGWELHVAAKDAVVLWDALQPIRPIGNNAISAMRIEKAYRAIGHELSADETPLEAGLTFAIDWDKEFLGKSALLEQKQAGIQKRLVNFVLDDPAVILWGSEPILFDEEVVGYTASACYSPTLGRSVAMGYVRWPAPLKSKDWTKDKFAIVNLGQSHSASAMLKAPYDPQRSKILC
jgi:glycine cleavage system aminomethyltransferase T/glycine/D-amino acid oxidase-like deaminating enzyme